MEGEKHDLVHEFPEYKEKIHQMKMDDTQFASLFNEYHKLNREIHRIETGVENTSDDYLEEEKKRRLKLKDDLFAMLQS